MSKNDPVGPVEESRYDYHKTLFYSVNSVRITFFIKTKEINNIFYDSGITTFNKCPQILTFLESWFHSVTSPMFKTVDKMRDREEMLVQKEELLN